LCLPVRALGAAPTVLANLIACRTRSLVDHTAFPIDTIEHCSKGQDGLLIDRLYMLSRRNERRLRRILLLVVSAIVVNLTLPTPTHAQSPTELSSHDEAEMQTQNVELVSLTPEIESLPPAELPELPTVANKPPPPSKEHRVFKTSAYSSTPDQTDATPFITASGTTVHDGTVANNCLPIGTQIRIPDHFGDKIFVVEDRMNERWGCEKIDIWMPTREAAINWGIPQVQIEIL
jgi:3D (Asp-Asp-Asp) domain-containing protein